MSNQFAVDRRGPVRKETTLEDISPPLGYLSYVPKRGRYSLLAVWGYGLSSGSSNRDAGCRFTIIDSEGVEVEKLALKSRSKAEAAFPGLRYQVQRMNKRKDVAA